MARRLWLSLSVSVLVALLAALTAWSGAAAAAAPDGAQPSRRASVALADQTQEGRWRFVNRAGERLTVATLDEMQRARRTQLNAALLADLSAATMPRSADARLAGIGGFVGNPAVAGVLAVRANEPSAAPQSGPDRRTIPGIPFAVQAGYAVLLVLGLLGTPVARTWWVKVWPAEARSDYAGRIGYWAACAARLSAFVLVFLPLTAAVAAPYSLGGQVWGAIIGPVRLWRRIAGGGITRKARRPPDQGGDHVATDAAPAAPAPPPVPPPAPPHAQVRPHLLPPTPPPTAVPLRPPVPVRYGGDRATADTARMQAPLLPAPVPMPPPIPLPRPAPAGQAQPKPSAKPARSWIAALPTEEEETL